MKILRTLKRLRDPRDLWLFLRILTMLLLLPRKIRRLSMPDILHQVDPGISTVSRDDVLMEKTTGFVDSLLKYRVFQRYGICLLRSLILFKFLRLQGWSVEIHFGVRKTAAGEADITGHSWLVHEDQPFLEPESQKHAFATTYSYPA